MSQNFQELDLAFSRRIARAMFPFDRAPFDQAEQRKLRPAASAVDSEAVLPTLRILKTRLREVYNVSPQKIEMALISVIYKGLVQLKQTYDDCFDRSVALTIPVDTAQLYLAWARLFDMIPYTLKISAFGHWSCEAGKIITAWCFDPRRTSGYAWGILLLLEVSFKSLVSDSEGLKILKTALKELWVLFDRMLGDTFTIWRAAIGRPFIVATYGMITHDLHYYQARLQAWSDMQIDGCLKQERVEKHRHFIGRSDRILVELVLEPRIFIDVYYEMTIYELLENTEANIKSELNINAGPGVHPDSNNARHLKSSHSSSEEDSEDDSVDEN